ncbi:MAG: hypothetical protein J3K34DRAFT_423715 [Monoraphidium minutum]|nr:MAG: hypothetical protein J3K34DRAFT_423715 [Monoraphidium minutum]
MPRLLLGAGARHSLTRVPHPPPPALTPALTKTDGRPLHASLNGALLGGASPAATAPWIVSGASARLAARLLRGLSVLLPNEAAILFKLFAVAPALKRRGARRPGLLESPAPFAIRARVHRPVGATANATHAPAPAPAHNCLRAACHAFAAQKD